MADEDQQQTEKSSTNLYSVIYTTQDFGLQQSDKQDFSPTFEALNAASYSVSTTRDLHSKGGVYNSRDGEFRIHCLNPGTSHTNGKVISSKSPNVSVRIRDITGKEATAVTKAYFDCREEDPRSSQVVEVKEDTILIEDDWIVLNVVPNTVHVNSSPNNQSPPSTNQLHQMALSKTEQNLIKASWVVIREDPVTAGLLLFDGLFTKFPRYLSYFPQFSIDMSSMKENKRLTKHAVKVIEKVTFVVDALGNEAMTSQLNEELVKLVRSHIQKKIGFEEFTNLGEVLIDFICLVNYHGLTRAYQASQLKEERQAGGQVIDGSGPEACNNCSETMTSTLEKIRASSTPPSSSDDESYLASVKQSSCTINCGGKINPDETMTSCEGQFTTQGGGGDHNNIVQDTVPEPGAHSNNKETRLDFNILVPAWRTLYKSIKDLVRQEEAASKCEQLPSC